MTNVMERWGCSISAVYWKEGEGNIGTDKKGYDGKERWRLEADAEVLLGSLTVVLAILGFAVQLPWRSISLFDQHFPARALLNDKYTPLLSMIPPLDLVSVINDQCAKKTYRNTGVNLPSLVLQ